MALYSDINQYDPTTKEILTDIGSIYQSINNILSTNIGERLFNQIGAELEELIHEPMDDTTAFEIYSYVIHAIEKWEPRARLKYSQCSIIPNYEEQRYDVILVFQILGFEDQEFKHEGTLEREV